MLDTVFGINGAEDNTLFQVKNNGAVYVKQLEDTSEQLEGYDCLQLSITNDISFSISAINNNYLSIYSKDLNKIEQLNLIPYIFRYSTKRNKLNSEYTSNTDKYKKISGWNLYYGLIKKENGGDYEPIVRLNNKFIFEFKLPKQTNWSSDPNVLMPIYECSDKSRYTNKKHFTWGKTRLWLINRNGKERDFKFRFGIAFGPKSEKPLKLSDMVTPLAEFSITYSNGIFRFSK